MEHPNSYGFVLPKGCEGRKPEQYRRYDVRVYKDTLKALVAATRAGFERVSMHLGASAVDIIAGDLSLRRNAAVYKNGGPKATSDNLVEGLPYPRLVANHSPVADLDCVRRGGFSNKDAVDMPDSPTLKMLDEGVRKDMARRGLLMWKWYKDVDTFIKNGLQGETLGDYDREVLLPDIFGNEHRDFPHPAPCEETMQFAIRNLAVERQRAVVNALVELSLDHRKKTHSVQTHIGCTLSPNVESYAHGPTPSYLFVEVGRVDLGKLDFAPPIEERFFHPLRDENSWQEQAHQIRESWARRVIGMAGFELLNREAG